MSVLVQHSTLVVRRHSLDHAYPGGVEAFLRAIRALPNPPRFACDTDPLLVNASFEHPSHVTDAVAMLEANGLVETENSAAIDYVAIDQQLGPLMTCPWLAWERFTDDVTVAWVAGNEPGALAAPAGWVPIESVSTTSTTSVPTPPPESERFLTLGVEDGSEVVLDLDTGAELHRPYDEAIPLDPDPDETMSYHAAVRAAAAEAGWSTYLDDAPAMMVEIRGAHALYVCRYFVSEELPAVVCYTRAPLFVPKPLRRKAAEFITRANYGLLFGNFEMSMDDGALFYRATCAIEDGVLTTRMVCTLANVGIWAMDLYFPRLLEVLYAKRAVSEAVSQAQGE